MNVARALFLQLLMYAYTPRAVEPRAAPNACNVGDRLLRCLSHFLVRAPFSRSSLVLEFESNLSSRTLVLNASNDARGEGLERCPGERDPGPAVLVGVLVIEDGDGDRSDVHSTSTSEINMAQQQWLHTGLTIRHGDVYPTVLRFSLPRPLGLPEAHTPCRGQGGR